jgi:hypothetical protein
MNSHEPLRKVDRRMKKKDEKSDGKTLRAGSLTRRGVTTKGDETTLQVFLEEPWYSPTEPSR